MKPMVYNRDSFSFELMCVYESNWTADTHMVKLDVNFQMKAMVVPPVTREMPQLHKDDTSPVVSFSIASSEELWAGKTVAAVYNASKDPRPHETPRMISMHLIRHLYDLHGLQRLLQSDPQTVNVDLMCRLFIVKAVPRINELFMLTGENIRKCDEDELRKDLLPYLRVPLEGIDQMVPTLKELTTSSREILNRVCSPSWTDGEKRFVNEFQNWGKYDPSELFEPGSAELERLRRVSYLASTAEANRLKRAAANVRR